jgi:drug/metabolite transporter (DMT)-like permease
MADPETVYPGPHSPFHRGGQGKIVSHQLLPDLDPGRAQNAGPNPGHKIPPQNPVMRKRSFLPMAAILTAVGLWGSSFSAMRLVLDRLDPIPAVFLRLFFASLCLLPFMPWLLPRNLSGKDLKLMGAMVLFQPCLYFLFESRALVYTTSAQAGVISACLPLMVAIAAWIFLSESINLRIVAGLFLSISGVIFLTLFQAKSTQAPHPVLGNLLELMAAASACGYIILVKQLSSRYTPWTLTAMQVLGGTLFFLPGIIPVITSGPLVWDINLILLLLFLGPCVSLAAFGLYNYGISRIDASRAAVCINLIPVIAVILGWQVLGEALNVKQAVAAAIVILGVLISNIVPKKTTTP